MSEVDRDDEALLRLAKDVADGRPVDWGGETTANPGSVDRIRRLQILAAIATTSGMPREVSGATPADARVRREPFFRWGHLEIREKVGEGAFGEVYRAWEETLQREVAVKFLRATPDSVDHILHEGRNLARVRHPNVVAVHGAESIEGRVGIWMEFIRGVTLEDILQTQGPLSAQEAATIGMELCRALAAVHAAGLVHNDIKTRNVMREEGGRIVLMDFGTGADPRLHPESENYRVTGTPFYLAPELLNGRPMSRQSDLYSLGVVLYRLVTRAYPFEAKSLDELRQNQERGAMKLLRDLRSDLPEPFIRAVEQALEVDPVRRFATAGELEKALAIARAGPAHDKAEPAAAVMSGAAAPTAGRWSRKRMLWAGAVAIALLAVGAAWFAPRLDRPPSPPTARFTLAVADFVNETGEANLDGLSSMLATSLEQSRSLSVVTRSRMNDILEQLGKEPAARIDEKLGVEIGRHAGLGALVLPTIRRFGKRYRIDVQVLDPGRNEYLFTAQESAEGRQRIPAMIDRLSERTRAALRVQGGSARAAEQSVERIVTPNLEAFRWYEEGERQIDRVEMVPARASLERAVSLDSTFGLAWSRLAYVYWWLADSENEHRTVERAWSLVDRVPERERYLLRSQRAVAESQGLEAGRAILLEMERFYPDDKQMLYSIGDLSFHLSEFPLAVRYLERVLEQDPKFVPALQHLTRTYREMGRREPMLATARRFAAVDTSWESRLMLGEALAATGATGQGIEIMSRGRDQYPERLLEFTNPLALAHAFAGEDARARADWGRLLAGAPATQRWGLHHLALWEASRGRCRTAVTLVERSIESARADQDTVAEALARVDRAALRLAGWNDPGPARVELGRRHEYDDRITYRNRFYDYWPYWGGLFKLALQCGMTSEAEALAREKFGLDKWYGPYVEAYLACAKGEWRQAEAAARQVLEWGPAAENVELLYCLASAQQTHGQFAAATESLRRLLALRSSLIPETPYSAKALLLLGRTQEEQGRADLALESCEKLAERWRSADADLPDRKDLMERLARLRSQRRAS